MKETISKVKRQPSEWEKIMANEATDKELISKIYKQLLKLNPRKNKWPNQKMGQRTKQTFLQRRWLVQPLSRVRLITTPWTAARQASLSITNTRSSPKPMSIESVMPSNHLILCRPLVFLPSIFPSIRDFSNESALRIRWPKYWSFSSTSVLPMNAQDWSALGWTSWISLQSKELSRVFSKTTVQKHQFFGAQLSL